MEDADFPPHIQELLQKMRENEDNDRKCRESPPLEKLHVYYRNPTQDGRLTNFYVYLSHDMTLADLTKKAYDMSDVNKLCDLEQCRLVLYDSSSEFVECSYEGKENELAQDLFRTSISSVDLFLEVRKRDEAFEQYLRGGVSTRVYVVDVPNREIVNGPLNVRAYMQSTLSEYKEQLARVSGIDASQMRVVKQFAQNYEDFTEPKLLEEDNNNSLRHEEFRHGVNVYVSSMLDTNPEQTFKYSTLYKIIKLVSETIVLTVQLPDTSKENLAAMGISLDGWVCTNGTGEAVALTNGPTSLANNKSIHLARPDTECSFKYKPHADLPEVGVKSAEENWDEPEQSCVVTISSERFKSDKTSLSFHEEQSHSHTIVESTETITQSKQGYEDTVYNHMSLNQMCLDLSKRRMDMLTASIENDEQPQHENCTEPTTQQSEPLDVALEQSNSEDSSLSDSDRTLVGDPPSTDDYLVPDDINERRHAIAADVPLSYRRSTVSEPREFYFQAYPINDEPQRSLRVMADKRIQLQTFTEKLQPYIGVPVEYFKIYRQSCLWDMECSQMTALLNQAEENDKLIVKLSRELAPGELKATIHVFDPELEYKVSKLIY